ASENGRKVRNIVDTQSVFPEVRLAADSKAKNLWHTAQGGQFMAVGIGSGVVGFGADVITIDDPFKKREEAESQVIRDHIDSWYKSEILTRRHRHTAIVIIMHRWHEDDLIGRRLAEAPHRWRRVRLPALAEDDDLLGRERGEALWPYRYTRDELLTIKGGPEQGGVGERNWTSLYQQRPAPEEGVIFKWWPTYKALPRIERLLMPIDTAYTDTSGADYTAWSLWWDDGSRIGIMDAQRVQMEAPEAEKELRRYYEGIKAEFPNVPVQPLLRKRVAIDRAVGQHLRRATEGHDGIPVVLVELPSAGGGDWKLINAKLVAPEFEGERMLIPAGFTPWLEAWLMEHKQFPNAVHDDWVETTEIVGRYRFGGRQTHETEYHEDSWLGGQE
ncbi:MAG: terminase family protein, partial [Dehalococcoidia bacterium]